jgi:hypothetical protein
MTDQCSSAIPLSNRRHVDDEYTPAFLDVLEKYVREAKFPRAAMPNEASALRFGHTRNDFGSSGEHSMFVAGVDGCRAGWVAFEVEVHSITTSVEVVNLPTWLRERPPDLACVGIDIPIGLLEGRRACDKAARKLLGQPRGSSVFPAPCRPALGAQTYAEASSINRQKTTRGLSQQAWGIAPKIKAGG